MTSVSGIDRLPGHLLRFAPYGKVERDKVYAFFFIFVQIGFEMK